MKASEAVELAQFAQYSRNLSALQGSEPQLSMADLEESYGYNVRVTNCLHNAGITSVWQLVQKTPRELLSIDNFGKTSLMILRDGLAMRGLHLGMTADQVEFLGAESKPPTPWFEHCL